MKSEELTQEDIDYFNESILKSMRNSTYEEIRSLREELKKDIERYKKSIKKKNFFIVLLASFIVITATSFVSGNPLFFLFPMLFLPCFFITK